LTLTAGVRYGSFDTQASDERYTRGDCQTVLDTVLVDVLPGPGVILVPILVPRQANCVDAYRLQGNRAGSWRNRGAELGLTWQPERALSVFGGWSRHFRNPNIDELLLASADLRPQSGDTVQTGIRIGASDRFEFSATAFHMRVDDEIYFGRDPVTGAGLNRNYEQPITRRGGELDVRWRPFAQLALRGSIGYVDARFQGTDNEIPLAPQFTVNASLEWAPRPWLRWLLSGHYVGARRDGNDLSGGQFPRLPAYRVWDAAVRLGERSVTLTAGINNLFNETYSTIAYSATYYPMPERNLYVSLRARF
jgi:outer membrane receptor protein involved in Fe transport